MADHLIVTPTNGRLLVEIRHDEDATPHKWLEHERAHPGAWFRALTAEESAMGFAELERLARAEHAQRQPKATPAIAAPATPQLRGVAITLDALKDMLRWSLICRHVITPDHDFNLVLAINGAVIVPITEKKI